MIWLALAIAAVALVVLGTRTPPRPRDLTPEEMEAARETEALTPGTPAWQRLDAPEWLKREGEKASRETEAYNRLKYGPDEKGWPS